MRRIAIYFLLFFTLPLGSSILAQQPAAETQQAKADQPSKNVALPVHFYRLDFVIEEVGAEGKAVNSRSYSTTISTDPKFPFSQIRAGSKVPIVTSSTSGESTQQRAEFQYQDIGVNIDVSQGFTREIGGELGFHLNIEVSSVASTTHVGGANGLDEPVVRQNRWSGPALVPIGKSTVILKSDNLDDKGTLQVLVTATLLQ
ncbi:MAG TPA: hypothetical protein VGG45_19800 [Terracidiphilus sp.]|jgi:hypothetical protein